MTIQEILDENGIAYSSTGKHSRDGWIQLEHCPFCDSDRYHLGWNLALNYANCWKCGGHSGHYVLKSIGIPAKQAKELLREIDHFETKKPKANRTGLKEPHGRKGLLRLHKEYLRKRGFDPNALQRIWSIEGIGLASRLSWRIYIPITLDGVRVSWTTRAIGSRVEQRYISASPAEEAIDHKSCIYGADFCYHSIVLVEGPTDAWAIGPGAGALFGTAFSVAQVRMAARFPHRYVCFDNERTAQERARELAGQLACFPGTTENIVLDADDPGSASEKELRLLRKAARI